MATALQMQAMPDRSDEDPATDAALAARVRSGSQDAFRELYERYAGAVLGFLAARLGDHALAEDALQEAFTKAYRSIDAYDERRPFGPWIAVIAENVATDLHRRRARQDRVASERAEEPPPSPSPDVDPIRVVSRREREEVLRQALTALPPDPRRVLLLRYQRGLTQREVADQLGCSTRTVQNREEAALELLATLLDRRRAKAQEKGS